jgi:hypothetical protein
VIGGIDPSNNNNTDLMLQSRDLNEDPISVIPTNTNIQLALKVRKMQWRFESTRKIAL